MAFWWHKEHSSFSYSFTISVNSVRPLYIVELNIHGILLHIESGLEDAQNMNFTLILKGNICGYCFTICCIQKGSSS